MRKWIIALLSLTMPFAFAADIKISQLPLGSASTAGVNDSFPYVAAATNITRRMTLWDLINLPPMVNTYAPKTNPVFTGTVTATTFVGSLTGNASTATAFAANPTDCSSNQFANAIAANGNLTCATIPNAATSGVSTNTPSTLVLRDGSGNFAAGAITADTSIAVGSITIAHPTPTPTPYTLTLPTSQGAAGTVMVNDGSGHLSWGAGGGGGGMALEWSTPDNGAIIDYHPDVGAKMYRFPAGGSEQLVGFIKVPAGYLAGNPISIVVGATQIGGSGTLLASATSYLIPPGTSFSSTTNSHASTNSAVSTASLQFQPQTIDVSEPDGEINGVPVAPGDIIRVVLTRGTDTATGDLLLMSSTTEVILQ